MPTPRRHRWIAGLALFVAALVGAAHAQEAPYLVNAGDTIEVFVWEDERLQRQVAVLPDGSFSMPLVGRVQAAGLAIAEIEEAVRQRLSPHYRNQTLEITVSVISTAGYGFYVVGEAAGPGRYALNARVDILQALAMAGGVTAFAKKGGIHIIRRIDGQATKIELNYNDAIRGRVPERDEDPNPIVQSGDIIVVP